MQKEEKITHVIYPLVEFLGHGKIKFRGEYCLLLLRIQNAGKENIQHAQKELF